MRAAPLIVIAIFAAAVLVQPSAVRPAPAELAGYWDSLVLLEVSYQEYLHRQPWEKSRERSRSGYGVVIAEDMILCVAELVRDATLIRAGKRADYRSYPAEVEFVDWDINLALVRVGDGDFFRGLSPVRLEADIDFEDPVVFGVMEETRETRSFPGRIVGAAVVRYPLSTAMLLSLNASVNLEGRSAGLGEPAWTKDGLVGLAMSYDSSANLARLVPAVVIQRFLEAVAKDSPAVPLMGFMTSPAVNPVLKEYLGLSPGIEGVYVRGVIPGSAAEGVVKRGDLLSRVGGTDIDSSGNYSHPRWGRLDFLDLVYRGYFPGDELEVEVWRDGGPLNLKVPLGTRRDAPLLIPVHTFASPRYLVAGGLVIQELTGDYLRGWGREWQHAANKKFLYHFFYDNIAGRNGREGMVIISRVLPAEVNIGYQDLADVVIAEINDLPILSFTDVDKALERPAGGFHRILLEEHNREIVLPVEGLEEADARIRIEYGID